MMCDSGRRLRSERKSRLDLVVKALRRGLVLKRSWDSHYVSNKTAWSTGVGAKG
jgi:hypothetical protein